MANKSGNDFTELNCCGNYTIILQKGELAQSAKISFDKEKNLVIKVKTRRAKTSIKDIREPKSCDTCCDPTLTLELIEGSRRIGRNS